MNTNEKILLIQLILEDIRDDWSNKAEKRALKAKSLCEEIINTTNNVDFTLLADYCDTYINSSKRWDDWDGRFFRQPFPMGYEKMDKLHNLKPTYNNKSNEFKTVVKEYILHPESRFSDVEIN